MLKFVDTILDAIRLIVGMSEISEYMPERKSNIMSEHSPYILLDNMSETMAK